MDFRRARAGAHSIGPKKRLDDDRPSSSDTAQADALAALGQKTGIGGMAQLLDAKAPARRPRPQAQVFDPTELGAALHDMGGGAKAPARRPRPQAQVFDPAQLGAALHDMGGGAKAPPARRRRPQAQVFDPAQLGAALHDMGGEGAAAPEALGRLDLGSAADEPGLGRADLDLGGQEPELERLSTADLELGGQEPELDRLSDAALGPAPADPAAGAQAAAPAAVAAKLPDFTGLTPKTAKWEAMQAEWDAYIESLPIGSPERDDAFMLMVKNRGAAAHAAKRPDRPAPHRRPGVVAPTDAEQDLVAKLMDENPELLKQMMVAKAQDRYLEDAIGGLGGRARGTTDLKHIANRQDKNMGLERVTSRMAALAQADVPGQAPVIDHDDAASLMRGYGLTEAEYVAIRTFSDNDYKYINPAVAYAKRKQGDDKKGWMESSMGSEKSSLFEEGGLHAGVMMQGLAKLPRMAGPTWRGERVTKAQLDSWFTPGKVTKKAQFQSTTVKKDVANRFANGEFRKPADDETVHVMCKIAISNAVNIVPFSKNATEEEWLLLPDTEFKVISRKQLPTGDAGVSPGATEWWEVSLVQTGPPIRTANRRFQSARP